MGGLEQSSFLRSCLLLLLGEQPDHGYRLVERLRPFGLSVQDTGNVYRALRTLERNGCLESDWAPSGSGPARRIYTLTNKGRTELCNWFDATAEARSRLDYYLRRLTPIIENASPYATVSAEEPRRRER